MKNNSSHDSFLKQLINISMGSIITLIIGFITTPIITRMVDPEIYGLYSLFTMTGSICLMFSCLGLDQGYIRFYYKLKEENRKLLLHFCMIFPSIIFTVLGWIGISILEQIINCKNFVLNLFFIISVFAMIINRFSLLVLRMQSKTKMYAIINIIHKISQVCFSLLAIRILGRNNIITLPISYTLSFVLVAITGIISSRDEFKISKDSLNFKVLPYKNILVYSIPLLISSGMFTIFQSLDKYCLNYFLDYTDVGIYSSAQHLMAVLSIVQTSFNIVWAPQSIKHFEIDPNDTSYYKHIHEYIVIIMMTFGIIVVLFKDIYVLLLGNMYRDAVVVIPFLILNPVMYTISETTVNGLYFKQKSKWVVLIVLISCLTNLLGNILLIPLLGIRGAAISTGVTYIFFFILRTTLSKRYFKVEYKEYRLYGLLIMYLLFATYSSYHKFDLITLFGSIFILCCLFFLYRLAMKELIYETIKKIKPIFIQNN